VKSRVIIVLPHDPYLQQGRSFVRLAHGSADAPSKGLGTFPFPLCLRQLKAAIDPPVLRVPHIAISDRSAARWCGAWKAGPVH
jgi:hypothetical protein